jgi:DNA transformation protein and related proteins
VRSKKNELIAGEQHNNMASNQETVVFITEQMNGSGNVRSRKMFGDYAVYCDDKVVALVCDDTLYLKVTEKGETLLNHAQKGQPYPNAKPALIVDEDYWDDREFMTKLVQETADALPAKKTKRS